MVPPAPSLAKPRWNLAWLLLLLLPLLAYALWPYPKVIQKSPDLLYVLRFEPARLFAYLAAFYGLYLLPGLLLFARAEPRGRFLTPNRFLLAFGWGMVVHVLAAFLQKYLQLKYGPVTVLACLAATYGLTAFLFRPLRFLLEEEKAADSGAWLAWPILGLVLILGAEMILRARTSSVSMTGDTYGHLVLLLATQIDGPQPNSLPFYSSFILNMYPMGFHAMLANLFVLTPGLEHIDLFRYFSLVFLPCFVFVFYAFFSFLSGSRALGAIGTLALFLVSGGGLTLRVPIVYFPWYWGLAWCLTAVIFYLLLKGQMASKALYFWVGILLGVGVLMHPMMAPRMGTILIFFLPLELLRRWLNREPWAPVFSRGGLFALGTAAMLGIWLGPLLLRFGMEETYSYEYILANFSEIAPAGVKYIKDLHELKFGLKDLYPWIWKNAGLFPMLLAPLGLIAAVLQFKKPAAPLLLAWLAAMVSAVLFAYLPNPYRYFEYLFFGLVALAVFGMGWASQLFSQPWRTLLAGAFLALALLGVRRDYWPKYALALNLYGRTDWPAGVYDASRRIVRNYQEAKAKGTLDEVFGEFRGFLWPRQKKVWDIYIRRQRPIKPPAK